MTNQGIEILRYIITPSKHDKCRQTFRTTALARAARDIGAAFIVMSGQTKRKIEKRFPGLDVRVARADALHGETKSVIFDHFVLEQYLFD